MWHCSYHLSGTNNSCVSLIHGGCVWEMSANILKLQTPIMCALFHVLPTSAESGPDCPGGGGQAVPSPAEHHQGAQVEVEQPCPPTGWQRRGENQLASGGEWRGRRRDSVAHSQTKGTRPGCFGLCQAAEREGFHSIPVCFPCSRPPSTPNEGRCLPGLQLRSGTLHYSEIGADTIKKFWLHSCGILCYPAVCLPFLRPKYPRISPPVL